MGIRVDALARTDADLVLLTPAHQFPTGTVLSAERRAALVRWAMDGSRRIMEDDYDAEYRYDREPIGAIQGLAPEHVIYGGSASKTLAPGMRLGWLVAPADLVDACASFKLSPTVVRRVSTSWPSPTSSRAASSTTICGGCGRSTGAAATRCCRRSGAPARVRSGGASAGLHVVAWLPPGLEEAPLIERAAAGGVAISGLAGYHAEPASARQGLLFGYGRVDETDIEQGIRIVAAALE